MHHASVRSTALSQTLQPISQPEAPDLVASNLPPQRSKLFIIWEKEFDGRYERMITRWVISE